MSNRDSTYRVHFLAILLTVFAVSGKLNASTICALDCPTDPGGSGNELPVMSEIISLGNVQLDIQNDGLIFLHIDLYNNLSALEIDPSTMVYFGLDELPLDTVIPDVLTLSTIQISDAIISGPFAIDYLLLRQFDETDQLILSATQGIVVLDTDQLFAAPVPAPAAAWLFVSGLFGLLAVVKQKRLHPRV